MVFERMYKMRCHRTTNKVLSHTGGILLLFETFILQIGTEDLWADPSEKLPSLDEAEAVTLVYALE
jgi:hypothetical protein